jgi:hypothetical protein
MLRRTEQPKLASLQPTSREARRLPKAIDGALTPPNGKRERTLAVNRQQRTLGEIRGRSQGGALYLTIYYSPIFSHFAGNTERMAIRADDGSPLLIRG